MRRPRLFPHHRLFPRHPRLLPGIPLLGILLLGGAAPALAATTLPAMPAALPLVLLRENNTTRTIACANQPVRIEGSRNTTILQGGCAGVTLRGDDDHVLVEIAPGSAIDLQGNGDRIAWSLSDAGAPPRVAVSGRDSLVTARPPPPEVPKPNTNGALVITGNEMARDLSCAGRVVVISASRGTYALRDGCAGLVVTGSQNMISAELQPDAPVRINGDGNQLAYVIPPGSTPPRLALAGLGTAAIAIPRFGTVWSPPEK